MKDVKEMKNSHNQPDEIFKLLSEPETTADLPKEIVSNTLNIVFDAINSIIGGLIITDQEGIIRFANPSFCKMFNYSFTDVVGKQAVELFYTNEVKKISDVLSIVDISKEDAEEFVVKRQDGTNFSAAVAASNVTSVSGEIVGRMASFVNITKRKEVEADRERLIQKLQDALDKIKVLRGIIPICASCKKIRDDKGYWNQIESYIRDHSEAEFSHGICPDCAKKLYPEFYK
jgi:PAS domain S-box-containing protein